MTHFENDEHEEHKEHKEHEKHDVHHHTHTKKKLKISIWKLLTVVLLVVIIAYLVMNFVSEKSLSEDEATAKIVAALTSQGVDAKVNSITDVGNLYSVQLEVAGRVYDSYVTKDGSLFFPQVVELDAPAADGTNQPPPAPAAVTKADKPTVELFVMAYCPYGTQAEKGILPVANLLEDKIDFKVEYVYYAMHGKKEVDENLRQVCIREEQEDKFNDYLACFLEAGEYATCLDQVKVDQSKLSACISKLDTQYDVTKNFNDQASWLSGQYPLFDVDLANNKKYSVGGSPTLVINGQQANSGRSPAEYLATICAAFNEAPEECTKSEGVSSETYSPGFGYEVGAATAASCG